MADPVREVVARALCPARHHLALNDADAVLTALRAAGFAVVRLPKPDDVGFIPQGVTARYDGVWAGTDGRMQVPGLGWMSAAGGRRTAAALLAAADAIEQPDLSGCDDCPAGCASCTGDTSSCECYVHEHVPVSERATSPADPAGGGS